MHLTLAAKMPYEEMIALFLTRVPIAYAEQAAAELRHPGKSALMDEARQTLALSFADMDLVMFRYHARETYDRAATHGDLRKPTWAEMLFITLNMLEQEGDKAAQGDYAFYAYCFSKVFGNMNELPADMQQEAKEITEKVTELYDCPEGQRVLREIIDHMNKEWGFPYRVLASGRRNLN